MTRDQIIVFISYKTSDKKIYKINEIANILGKQPKIAEVLYWEKDVDGDIIDYMNYNLERCDILLLFCSENTKYSNPVELEWKSAVAQEKPIIPIFTRIKHVPPLLLSMRGFEYVFEDITFFSQEIYKMIIDRINRKLLPNEIIRKLSLYRSSENLLVVF